MNKLAARTGAIGSFRITLFSTILGASIACNGEASTEASSGTKGTWALRELDGKPLPMVCFPINCPAFNQFGNLGMRVDVLGSTLTVTNATDWSERYDLSVVTTTGTISQIRTIYGSYKRDGALIHFSAAGDPAYLDCTVTGDIFLCSDGRAQYTRPQ